MRSRAFLVGAARAAPLRRSEFGEASPHAGPWSATTRIVRCSNTPYDTLSNLVTDGTAKPLGVYVHFPWCLKKCPYCDFLSVAAAREAIPHAAYADAVLRELGQRLPGLSGRYRLETVFFGGGTPSLW